MAEFDHITTGAAITTYESAKGVFDALLQEVRELSRKKPDATLSKNKVKLVNNVLRDLMSILEGEPQGKYLQILEDDALPQVSDALMMMAQFGAALDAFRRRYYQYVKTGPYTGESYWITHELLEEWEADETEVGGEDGEDEG